MVEEYNLSFLNLERIKKVLLNSQTNEHGLVTEGTSSYNVGPPILFHPQLRGLNLVIEKYVRLYCENHNIPSLKLINSWFNITKAGNKLKAHKHEESIISGAFYLTNGVPLIFSNAQVNPYPGLLCIFSSDLVHYTEEETQERIVISFNTDYL